MANEQMPTPAAKKSTNKINDKSFARLNTVAVVAANFLGATLIFSAFAGFFKKWHYYVPVVGNFYNNTSLVETNLITAVIALALGIFGIAAIGKVRDMDTVKKTWCVAAKIFLVFTFIYAAELVATMLFSMLAISKESGVKQGDLWLNGFLGQMISAGICCGMFFISKAIADGKLRLAKNMSIVGISLAGAGFFLAVISIVVNMYA
jgi:hypothetical protein